MTGVEDKRACERNAGAGLLRVATVPSWTEKAWVLRDTFDGLLDVATRYARARGTRTP